jgi:hypothetical protein
LSRQGLSTGRSLMKLRRARGLNLSLPERAGPYQAFG